MGSRTTYYSLAKDRLKGNHPRIYNLILILTLMSLTGTAAFLISDIFSFGIDYDDMSIQGGKGIILPALWGDKKASSGAADDEKTESYINHRLNCIFKDFLLIYKHQETERRL